MWTQISPSGWDHETDEEQKKKLPSPISSKWNPDRQGPNELHRKTTKGRNVLFTLKDTKSSTINLPPLFHLCLRTGVWAFAGKCGCWLYNARHCNHGATRRKKKRTEHRRRVGFLKSDYLKMNSSNLRWFCLVRLCDAKDILKSNLSGLRHTMTGQTTSVFYVLFNLFWNRTWTRIWNVDETVNDGFVSNSGSSPKLHFVHQW